RATLSLTLVHYTTLFRSARQSGRLHGRNRGSDVQPPLCSSHAGHKQSRLYLRRKGDRRFPLSKSSTWKVQQLPPHLHQDGNAHRSEEHTSELQSRFDLVC